MRNDYVRHVMLPNFWSFLIFLLDRKTAQGKISLFVNQRSSAVSAAQKTGHSSDFDHDPGLHKPKCLDGGAKV